MEPSRFEELKRTIGAELTLDQVAELERVVGRLLSERSGEAALARRTQELAEARACPRCGGRRVVKNGRDARGLQRFLCVRTDDAGCGRSFNALTLTPLSRLRKSHLWLDYAQAMTQLLPVRFIRRRVPEISHATAWRWRHRFLALPAFQQAARLGGIVEADETYFLRAFKGHRGWVRGNPPENRPPRYRGGASGPGLSGFRVPVLSALDRTGARVEAPLPGRQAGHFHAALDGRIEPGSILCTDGNPVYRQVAARAQSEHRVIEIPRGDNWLRHAVGSPPRTPGVLTLGRVNQHHSEIKATLNGHFRGVSTRYVPQYLAWLRFLQAQDRDPTAFLEAGLRPLPVQPIRDPGMAAAAAPPEL